MVQPDFILNESDSELVEEYSTFLKVYVCCKDCNEPIDELKNFRIPLAREIVNINRYSIRQVFEQRQHEWVFCPCKKLIGKINRQTNLIEAKRSDLIVLHVDQQYLNQVQQDVEEAFDDYVPNGEDNWAAPVAPPPPIVDWHANVQENWDAAINNDWDDNFVPLAPPQHPQPPLPDWSDNDD